MADQDKVQSYQDAVKEAAEQGARMGAKARRREASESAAQTAAVLAAERGEADRAVWESTYRSGTDENGEPIRQTIRHREDAREHLTAAELLRAGYDAAKIAAAKVAGKHGVPPLSPDEIAELRDELVTRLLTDANPGGARGNLPRRDRITRSYLVQRAGGIILNDPSRALLDKDQDGGDVSPDDLAAGAESQAASRKAAHDPMLNESADGTWPEVAAAGEIVAAPPRARRAAAYLTGGGRAESWARHWGQSPKQARQKSIPEGTAWLRRNGSRFAAAVRMAELLDRDGLDEREADRARVLRGLTEAIDPPRKITQPRERLEPDAPAPVTVTRTRKGTGRKQADARAAAAGWTRPLT